MSALFAPFFWPTSMYCLVCAVSWSLFEPESAVKRSLLFSNTAQPLPTIQAHTIEPNDLGYVQSPIARFGTLFSSAMEYALHSQLIATSSVRCSDCHTLPMCFPETSRSSAPRRVQSCVVSCCGVVRFPACNHSTLVAFIFLQRGVGLSIHLYFFRSDVFLLCNRWCSTADCSCCLFCGHFDFVLFFEETVGLAPQPAIPVIPFCVCRVVHGRYCVCIESNSVYNITSLRVLFVPSPTCDYRVEDYWEGYKLFCYAYYSHSLQHEYAFKQSKLGLWFCLYFPPMQTSFLIILHGQRQTCQCIVHSWWSTTF